MNPAVRVVAKAMVALVVSCTTPSSTDGTVVVTAGVVNEDDGAIEFKIANRTSEPLVVIDRFLPWGGNAANWGNEPALEMDAIDGRGRQLRKIYPLREIGPDATTSIPPGAVATGRLQASHYFAGVREALQTSSIEVRWRYRLKPVGRNEIIFHGVTVLPEQ